MGENLLNDRRVFDAASLDYEVLVGTRGARRMSTGAVFPLADRVDTVLEAGEYELSTIAFLEGVPYQLVVVPLLVPAPDAWICLGFRIDDAFVAALHNLTLSHVTLLTRDPERQWASFASTLDMEQRDALPSALAAAGAEHDVSLQLILADEPFVSLVTALDATDDGAVIGVLQRSMDDALVPYLRFRRVHFALFFGALALCSVVGTTVARSVSRPVLEIASAAGRVQRGDYGSRVVVRQQDEIGRLAEAFNHMVRGLEERDRVRSLLGKVVSPEVASVLMSKEIELGGEEREVTVLFSDVCDFATLCEGGSPSVILDRLNRYLSVMSRVIEAENGIVDKYAGDAVMALFGAPIAHVDDGARAVRAALEMQRALQPLNEILLAEGAADLRIGVGINTAVVVAGNMGSPSRLNYTVIGDGVNLAARIEGLTKVYGVGVLVSAATRDAAPDFVYREVDRVKVKGKRELVTIYEPLGPPAEVGAPARAQVDAHHRALEAYRRQDWNAAHEGFTALQKIADAPLTALFLERIDELRHLDPGPESDGTFTHIAK